MNGLLIRDQHPDRLSAYKRLSLSGVSIDNHQKPYHLFGDVCLGLHNLAQLISPCFFSDLIADIFVTD